MVKGKAFLVVGHKNWGKSSTLKALTNNSRFIRKWRIKSVEFFVRRMSNDDVPKSLLALVTWLDPTVTPYVIATLCPTFNDEKTVPMLLKTLEILREKYKLFFFVLQHKGSNPGITIPRDEIDKLERYGTVEVFGGEGNRPSIIATSFQHFVEQNL